MATGDKDREKAVRLAAALRENLHKRKARARADANSAKVLDRVRALREDV